MTTSNIVFASNLYPCKEDWTHDMTFLQQVTDYQKLYNLENNKYGSDVPVISSLQEKILGIGSRCTYAKNDPCWGIGDNGKVICRCVNGNCPIIMKCNPYYSSDYRKEWIPDGDEALRYGKPNEMPVQYIVDLVSMEEKKSYFSNPEMSGKSYDILEESSSERKKIIIGYERTKFSDYCDETMTPIWGYEDSIRTNFQQSIYGSSSFHYAGGTEQYKEYSSSKDEKYNTFKSFKEFNSSLNKNYTESRKSLDKNKKPEEATISFENFKDHYSLSDVMDMVADYNNTGRIYIISQHEGELFSIANYLMLSGIPFGVVGNNLAELLMLARLSDEIDFKAEDIVGVTSEIAKNGKIIASNKIINRFKDGKQENVIIDISKQEYTTVNNRWTKHGLFGMTHISLLSDDIFLYEKMEDGKYPIILNNIDEQKYEIIYDDEIIGESTKGFHKQLDEFIEDEEIIAWPSKVKNLLLLVSNGYLSIVGLGHMKFSEY